MTGDFVNMVFRIFAVIIIASTGADSKPAKFYSDRADMIEGEDYLARMLFDDLKKIEPFFSYPITNVWISFNFRCTSQEGLRRGVAISGFSHKSAPGGCKLNETETYNDVMSSNNKNIKSTMLSVRFLDAWHWKVDSRFHDKKYKLGYFRKTNDCRLFIGRDGAGRTDLIVIEVLSTSPTLQEYGNGRQQECLVRGELVGEGFNGAATMPFDLLASRNPSVCMSNMTCSAGGLRFLDPFVVMKMLERNGTISEWQKGGSLNRGMLHSGLNELDKKSGLVSDQFRGFKSALKGGRSDVAEPPIAVPVSH